MTIKQKLKQFRDTAKSKNIKLWYTNELGVDSNIMNWIPNATVSTIAAPQGNWKKVDTQNGTTESEMLKTAVIMPLSCAVDTFIAELQKGTFDTLSTYRIIFLEEKDSQGRALKLVCYRHDVGKLDLYVYQVNPGRTWYDADGAWLQQQDTQFLPQTLSDSDSLTLEAAIKICKEAGLKVIKIEIKEVEL